MINAYVIIYFGLFVISIYLLNNQMSVIVIKKYFTMEKVNSYKLDVITSITYSIIT